MVFYRRVFENTVGVNDRIVANTRIFNDAVSANSDIIAKGDFALKNTINIDANITAHTDFATAIKALRV